MNSPKILLPCAIAIAWAWAAPTRPASPALDPSSAKSIQSSPANARADHASSPGARALSGSSAHPASSTQFTSSTLSQSSAASRPSTPTLSLPPLGEAWLLDEKGVENLLRHHGRRLLVVNFWATWCAPCVEELPDFFEAAEKVKSRDVLFIGLSTDLLSEWKSTVPPFLKEKKATYPNFVLSVDSDRLIGRFSAEWSGALPATFYFDRTGRKLGERLGAVSKKQLLKDIVNFTPELVFFD